MRHLEILKSEGLYRWDTPRIIGGWALGNAGIVTCFFGSLDHAPGLGYGIAAVMAQSLPPLLRKLDREMVAEEPPAVVLPAPIAPAIPALVHRPEIL